MKNKVVFFGEKNNKNDKLTYLENKLKSKIKLKIHK